MKQFYFMGLIALLSMSALGCGSTAGAAGSDLGSDAAGQPDAPPSADTQPGADADAAGADGKDAGAATTDAIDIQGDTDTLDAVPDTALPGDATDVLESPDAAGDVEAADIGDDADALADAVTADSTTDDADDVAALDVAETAPDVPVDPCAGKACSDGDPCTDDLCEPATGACAHAAKAGCTFAVPCSSDADCTAGKCAPALNACVECQTDAECGPVALCKAFHCVKATPCTSDIACKSENKLCDKVFGGCVDCLAQADCGTGEACIERMCVKALPCASSKQCPDGVCDTTKGYCVVCVEDVDCADGLWCSSAGACLSGLCAGPTCAQGKAWVCAKEGIGYAPGLSCDDGDACTLDTCSEAAGCQHAPAVAACDDGNPCTDDGCDKSTGCTHTTSSAPCDDGDVCTVLDTCSSGTCKGLMSKSCDDANVCTLDTCDKAAGGCVNAPTPGACDDGDACTLGDACAAGACKGSAMPCDDANPCTLDGCASGSCTHTPSTGACDDGNLCTDGDTCSTAGECVGGGVKSCDDAAPCTVDACSPTTGCAHTPSPEGSACGEDKACDNAGACISTGPAGMRLVPGGTFSMGCVAGDTGCSADEKPQHAVTIGGFYLDANEVTVAKYKACVDAGVCTAPKTGAYFNWGVAGHEQHPVNGVSWTQADAYCTWPGVYEGKGRLPTEAEWERAARGGLDGKLFPLGDSLTCAMAVYDGNSTAGCDGAGTQPVGSKPAGKNAYGLNDMTGNVSEWVADWYAAGYYASSPASNPKGPASGSGRVQRGGAFSGAPAQLHLSIRYSYDPSFGSMDRGFRCARQIP